MSYTTTHFFNDMKRAFDRLDPEHPEYEDLSGSDFIDLAGDLMGRVTLRYVCAECGGSSIEIHMWADPNTNIVSEGEWPNSSALDACHAGNTWCHDCSEHVDFTEVPQ